MFSETSFRRWNSNTGVRSRRVTIIYIACISRLYTFFAIGSGSLGNDIHQPWRYKLRGMFFFVGSKIIIFALLPRSRLLYTTCFVNVSFLGRREEALASHALSAVSSIGRPGADPSTSWVLALSNGLLWCCWVSLRLNWHGTWVSFSSLPSWDPGLDSMSICDNTDHGQVSIDCKTSTYQSVFRLSVYKASRNCTQLLLSGTGNQPKLYFTLTLTLRYASSLPLCALEETLLIQTHLRTSSTFHPFLQL